MMIDNLANYCTIYMVDSKTETYIVPGLYENPPYVELRPQSLHKVVTNKSESDTRQYFEEWLVRDINRQILNEDGFGTPRGIRNKASLRANSLSEAWRCFPGLPSNEKLFWLFEDEHRLHQWIRDHRPNPHRPWLHDQQDGKHYIFGVPVLFTGIECIVLADLAHYIIATPTPEKLRNPQLSGSPECGSWSCRWDGVPFGDSFVVVTE